MFWNYNLPPKILNFYNINRKHEMFWNVYGVENIWLDDVLTVIMNCFEMSGLCRFLDARKKLTVNMKCFEMIEITEIYINGDIINRKHEMFWNYICSLVIPSIALLTVNMKCFEI